MIGDNAVGNGVPKRPYTSAGRLADVLALIQVLALDRHAHRSESGLLDELQGKPCSAQSWTIVGREHPEFFRVATEGEHQLSLVARHVVPRDADGVKALPSDFVHELLRTAIELHDRQLESAEWWKKFMPLLAALASALVAGAYTLIAVWLARRF